LKLQFDTGRGTNMRLSQIPVTPQELTAVFFNILSQFIEQVEQEGWGEDAYFLYQKLFRVAVEVDPSHPLTRELEWLSDKHPADSLWRNRS